MNECGGTSATFDITVSNDVVLRLWGIRWGLPHDIHPLLPFSLPLHLPAFPVTYLAPSEDCDMDLEGSVCQNDTLAVTNSIKQCRFASERRRPQR